MSLRACIATGLLAGACGAWLAHNLGLAPTHLAWWQMLGVMLLCCGIGMTLKTEKEKQ
jgi:Na+/H+ antiporter NhaA